VGDDEPTRGNSSALQVGYLTTCVRTICSYMLFEKRNSNDTKGQNLSKYLVYMGTSDFVLKNKNHISEFQKK
jgi:hypothetical protein